MSPEAQLANSSSWAAVEADIEQYPDSQWKAWKAIAHEFIFDCVRLGLNRYFRAGQSMHHFVFSTLDHHCLRDEPRVTVELHPGRRALRIAYGRRNLYFSTPELEYTLPFDAGIATFRRFLKQLWTVTVAEAFPEELNHFSAPILPSPDRSAQDGACRTVKKDGDDNAN
jgi:hypothetical protein